MRKYLVKRVVTGLTVGAIALGGYGAVLASSDNAGIPADRAAIVVSSEFKGPGGPDMKIERPDMIGNLVTSGIIDQETADKISAYKESLVAERKAKMEKVKNMTEEEKQAYFESMKEAKDNNSREMRDLFSDMVSAGVLTQEQADAIKAAMPAPADEDADRTGYGKGFGRGPGMNGERPDMVSNLVSEGIIDQETADKISAYQESLAAERKAEMEKVKNMTEEEKQAYFESMKEAKENNSRGMRDPFSDMVSAGVLTQEQADAIKAAMPTPPERPVPGETCTEIQQ